MNRKSILLGKLGSLRLNAGVLSVVSVSALVGAGYLAMERQLMRSSLADIKQENRSLVDKSESNAQAMSALTLRVEQLSRDASRYAETLAEKDKVIASTNSRNESLAGAAQTELLRIKELTVSQREAQEKMNRVVTEAERALEENTQLQTRLALFESNLNNVELSYYENRQAHRRLLHEFAVKESQLELMSRNSQQLSEHHGELQLEQSRLEAEKTSLEAKLATAVKQARDFEMKARVAGQGKLSKKSRLSALVAERDELIKANKLLVKDNHKLKRSEIDYQKEVQDLNIEILDLSEQLRAQLTQPASIAAKEAE